MLKFRNRNQDQETPNQNQEANQNQNENPNATNLGYLGTEEETPQPKKRGRKPGSVTATRQADSIKKIRYMLESMFGTVSGFMVAGGGIKEDGTPKPLAADGLVIRAGAPNLIDALCALCETDKYVRDFFLSLTTSSAYANVVIASMPIVIGIMANHNLIPPIFGSPAVQTVNPNGKEN